MKMVIVIYEITQKKINGNRNHRRCTETYKHRLWIFNTPLAGKGMLTGQNISGIHQI